MSEPRGSEPLDPSDRHLRWGWKGLALATSSVIVLSAVRGIRRGYEVIGDNALIELRARDVLTAHHPFLGTWSSASISSSVDVNHPGPLLFDLVAAPVRIFGGADGIALGVAALAIAIVWAVGFVTARAGGPAAALVVQVVTAGIAWTLGSELLYDAWQPNVLVLPFWLLLCTVWAIVADRVELLPLAVLVGSFCMQTHLGYLFLVPILLGFALAVVVLRRRARGPGRFDDLWAPLRNTAIVGLVLWAQPLWEQLFGAGQGNFSRLLTAGTGGGGKTAETADTGLSLGVRLFSSVVAQPPWWLRPGFETSVPSSTWIDTPDGRVLSAPGLPGLGSALVGLAVLAVVAVLGWLVARRRSDRAVERGYWVLALCGAVAIVTLVITPIDILGLTPHKIRYLWIIGAFATYLLLLSVLGAVRSATRRVALAGLAVVGLVAVVATIPVHVNDAGPIEGRGAAYESIGDIRSQLADYLAHDPSAPGAVRFDADGIGFAEPYTSPVMAQLLESGVDLVVADPSLGRQLGPRRLADGDDADRPVVFVRAGAAALEEHPGVERIAFHDGDRSPFHRLDVTDRAVGVFLSHDGTVPGWSASSVRSVDIVVPVHNEEDILESSVERLRAHLEDGFPFRWRIVIADNASTDATPRIAARLAAADERIRHLCLTEKGRGRALRAAWSQSEADVVAYTDVDLSTGLTGLLPLVAPLLSGHSDLAIGSRLSSSSVVARGPKREFISRCYNLLLRVVFAVRFRDAQCGFKAGRTDVVRRLLPAVEDQAWFFDTELLLLAEYNGLRVHEVPVDWIDDPDSRVEVRSTALADLQGVWRMAWRFARGNGGVDLGKHERAPLADDFGRQTVTYASIGLVSTAVSLVLFLLLRDRIGAVGANVIAFTSTAIGNSWAHRRWTFRRRSDEDRRWRMATGFAVFIVSLLGTSVALAAVEGNSTAELVVLAITWTAAALFRFVVLRVWVYRR